MSPSLSIAAKILETKQGKVYEKKTSKQNKKDFKNKQDIEDILLKYNHQILNSSLTLDVTEIAKIELIRKKLVNKRHRK